MVTFGGFVNFPRFRFPFFETWKWEMLGNQTNIVTNTFECFLRFQQKLSIVENFWNWFELMAFSCKALHICRTAYLSYFYDKDDRIEKTTFLYCRKIAGLVQSIKCIEIGWWQTWIPSWKEAGHQAQSVEAGSWVEGLSSDVGWRSALTQGQAPHSLCHHHWITPPW